MSEKVIVIGSGPGGYKSAVYAAKEGFKVTLIEKGEIGGVCTNRGCIPSKALLSISGTVDDVKNSRRKGISAEFNNIDFPKAQKIKDRAVLTSRKGIENQIDENDINLIKGEAKLLNKNEVEVNGEIYLADYIIIATGSEPIILPNIEVDEKNILTSKGALNLDNIPESMVIIGGGYIGIELAFVYSSLGTDITIVELLDQILPNMDKDLSKETEKILKRKRIKIYTGSKVSDVKNKSPLEISVEGKVNKIIEAEKVLCAVGRKPNPPDTELNIIGDNGEIITDEYMETPVKGVFAVGDVNGKMMLAHAAYKQAKIAIEKISRKDSNPFSKYAVPAGVYIHPEIASVGLTEGKAREKFDDIDVGTFPISASGRGYSTGERTGLAKVIAYDGNIIGMHLICPGATDIIMEGTIAIDNGINLEKFSDIIHPHPTYSEALMNAAENALN